MELKNIRNIKCFVFDYDGVLSDGSILMLPSGEGLRRSNVLDGYAIHHAVQNGYIVAVLSGGRGENMRMRMHALGVTEVFLGVTYKKEVFENFLIDKTLKASEVLFMGDDIPDFEVMRLAGIATCPDNACKEIKSVADYISPYKGGNGAVRDVIEMVLKEHGKWMNENAFYW